MIRKSLFFMIHAVIILMTISLSSCGEDDSQDVPASNQSIYVNGEKWVISNYNPPSFGGDFNEERYNYTPYITSAALRKKDKNEKYLLNNSGLIISIIQSTWYPESLKTGVNLIGNTHIERIDVDYVIYDGNTEIECGFYSGTWSYIGKKQIHFYGSGSLIITELVKEQKLTLKFIGFKIPLRTDDAAYSNNCPQYLTLDGTVSFKYDGEEACVILP